MHEKKLYTSYFEGVLRCNRISNAYSGLNRHNSQMLVDYSLWDYLVDYFHFVNKP